MEGEGRSTELQLLPKHISSSSHPQWTSTTTIKKHSPSNNPFLELKLSIGVGSLDQSSDRDTKNAKNIQALRWRAAEQIRLSAIEKAYAEQVRELTRREMEMAAEEFTRAKDLWDRAREEVEKAERMKETAMSKVSSTCAEITCRACQQRFRP